MNAWENAWENGQFGKIYTVEGQLSPIYKAKRHTALLKTCKRRVMTNYSRTANTFAALLIIEMLMNYVSLTRLMVTFIYFVSLYIGDNDNNTTFVG